MFNSLDLLCEKFLMSTVKKSPSWFSPACYDVLASLCETFIPSTRAEDISAEYIRQSVKSLIPNLPDDKPLFKDLSKVELDFLSRGAIDDDVPSACVRKIDNFVPAEDKKEFAIILWLMSYSIGTFLLTGYFKPFSRLSLQQRHLAVTSWQKSRFVVFRTLYQTFKRLTGLLYFSYNERGKVNKTWKAIGYDPSVTVGKPSRNPTPTSTLKSKFQIDYIREQYQEKDDLHVDVVIIGSGSGGGTIASELTKAGLKVLVLEKGGYYDSKDFREWNEAEAFDKLYERGGLFSSKTGGIAYLAGSCVGGGSTVNWSASFRTPDWVLRDWEQMDMPIFRKGGEFEASIDAVLKLFHVNCDNSYHPAAEEGNFAVNLNNQLLYESAERLGYKPEHIPRNVKNCVDCGHCNHGCPYNAKQSTVTNLMTPLIESNRLQVLEHCYVEKVLYSYSSELKRNQAYGVDCTLNNDKNQKLRVYAKVVICAGGSIHSPALLLRSKFKNPQIGKNFSCHPVIGSIGIFPDQQTGMDKGVSMGVIVRNNSSDSKAPRLAIETPPLHPGSLGLVMPWMSGFSYKLTALLFTHLSAFIHIMRDRSCPENRIAIDKDGNPVIHYQITAADRQEMMRVALVMYNLMYVAGPDVMMCSSETIPWYYNKKDIALSSLPPDEIEKAIARDSDYQAFLKKFLAQGIIESNTGVFSAHQMSSCRMAASPSQGPVMTTGELWECENLFVADASLCPTSLGINPMITTAAFGHYVSRNVIKKLNIKLSSTDF
jgi:choline dehydrogenase-like flavoprotein